MATLIGTNLNDMLLGTMADDVIRGRNGNDTISDSLGGNNRFFGEQGDDVISASAPGSNFLSGDAGNDVLQAVYGDSDTLLGGLGKDTVISALSSGSWLDGSGGSDLLVGVIAADATLSGGADGDVLLGILGNGVLSGDAGNDFVAAVIFTGMTDGGSGNDTIVSLFQSGLGDTAVLKGASGNDIITLGLTSLDGLGASGPAAIDGGTGTDTLRLVMDQNLDLTTVADNRIAGIEILDLESDQLFPAVATELLGGMMPLESVLSGASTVKLDAASVVALSSSTNTLYIYGDGTDTVDLTAGGFADTGVDSSLGGRSYSIYKGGSATVFVDNDVTVV